MEPMKPMSPMKPMEPMTPQERWWPEGLGVPASTGGQNDLQYAYFAKTHRLAVKQGGETKVYDTGDHQIGGVSQQQSGKGGGVPAFTSQHGPVPLDELKVVS